MGTRRVGRRRALALVLSLVAAAALALAAPAAPASAEGAALADGTYAVSVELGGGSGRASVQSPCELSVSSGSMVATVTWSSPNYDLMVVDGQRLSPVNEGGNSTFEVPVSALGEALPVQAETTAMSRPHLIDYTLTFSDPQRQGAPAGPAVAVAAGLGAAAVAVGAALLVHRRRARRGAAEATPAGRDGSAQ
ncbi:MAG: hypothetical protein SOH58_00290 [Olsenella sp.]|jgi:outer membrane lipoprotein-sorting protein